MKPRLRALRHNAAVLPHHQHPCRRLPVRRRWNDPRLGRFLHIRRQLPAVHKVVQSELRHCGLSPWQGVQHNDWLGWSHCRREVKQGWRRHNNKASSGKDKEVRPRKENKKKGR
jgi:hypothetical protein